MKQKFKRVIKKALIVVDVQNDFCPEGSFPVSEGNQIVKPLNKMLTYARKNGWKIFASRDWHSAELFKKGGCERHCVQNTKGAEYHPELDIQDDIVIVSKGSNDLSDRHYSAFNGDEISLEEKLKEADVEEVYIGGLALDYCVKNTAIDAAKRGFKTFVILDATRAVDNKTETIKATKEEIEKFGIKVINSSGI